MGVNLCMTGEVWQFVCVCTENTPYTHSIPLVCVVKKLQGILIFTRPRQSTRSNSQQGQEVQCTILEKTRALGLRGANVYHECPARGDKTADLSDTVIRISYYFSVMRPLEWAVHSPWIYKCWFFLQTTAVTNLSSPPRVKKSLRARRTKQGLL